jgi:hypothetical protein
MAYKYLSSRLLLGIYIVSSSYFLTNDIYFPSIDSVRVFTNSFFTNSPITTGLSTSHFEGNAKFFPSHYRYNKRSYSGISRRAELSIRNYRLSVKHTKLLKSKLLFLKNYLADLPALKAPKVVNYLFRFFKRNRTRSYKSTTDRLLRSLTMASKIYSTCKTFKLSRVRVKYFSEFECIYNPSIINDTTSVVTHSAQLSRKHLINKPDLKITKVVYRAQSIFKSTKNTLLRKYITHSNIYFMPFCFKLVYFFNSNIYLITKMSELGSNLIPNYNCFNYKLAKHIHSAGLNCSFRENVTP